MAVRLSIRRLNGLLAMPILGVALLGLTAFSGEACLTNACERSDSKWGEVAGEGSLIDANTWQSTPIDGEWVAFPHSVRVAFTHTPETTTGRPRLGRVPSEIVVWISAEKQQGRGTNFTVAGGDVAKISDVSDRFFAVTNGTCADYYVRVVVRAAPFPAGSVDAGADGAGAADGAADVATP